MKNIFNSNMNTLTELSQRLDDKGILGIFIKPLRFSDRSFLSGRCEQHENISCSKNHHRISMFISILIKGRLKRKNIEVSMIGILILAAYAKLTKVIKVL